MHRRILIPGAALALCFALPLHAQTLRGELALTSQLVDRGLAIAPATPSLEGELSWTTTDWSAGLSGGAHADSPGHVLVTLARVSHYTPLSDNWQIQTSLYYYHYSSDGYARIYDRAEGGAYASYRDLLKFGVSEIYTFGTRSRQLHPSVDLDLNWPLARHLTLTTGFGMSRYILAPYHRSSGRDRSVFYRYGHAGLLLEYGSVRIELDRVATDSRMRRRWRSLVASPWLATVSWSF